MNEKKTSPQFYQSIIFPQMRAGVRAALYNFLHLQNIYYLWNDLRRKEKSRLGLNSCRYQEMPGSYDILFNYTDSRPHYFGVQERMARQCSTWGLKTVITDSMFQNADMREFKRKLAWYPLYPVALDVEKEIIEQSYYVFSILGKMIKLNELQRKLGLLYLVDYARLIEAYTASIRVIMDRIKVGLVILQGSIHYSDLALQLVCKEKGIVSIFVPHGMQPLSVMPVISPVITSFSSHHDNYLKEMSLADCRVEGLGWLEPRISLNSHIGYLLNRENTTGKHHILLLSQYSGATSNRCDSYYTLLPKLIKLLLSMKSVARIILRLHPGESLESRQILSITKESLDFRLHISCNEPLIKDLKESNMLMGFSSTALLLAPYLNMRGVEIRDSAIDTVCPCTVLPPEHSFQVKEEFDHRDLKAFINRAKEIDGEKALYNWRREWQAFSRLVLRYI